MEPRLRSSRRSRATAALRSTSTASGGRAAPPGAARRAAPEPVDLIAGRGALEPSPRPLAGCFEVERELALPEAAVGAMSSSAVALAHSCGAPLAIDEDRAARPGPRVQPRGTAAPVVLEAGSAGELRVVYRPTEAAAREEVALIEVSSPEVLRRAVTLFVPGAP